MFVRHVGTDVRLLSIMRKVMTNEVTIGIDISLRTTACVAIKNDKTICGCSWVTSNPKEINDEDLLIYNSDKINYFIDMWSKYEKRLCIEGLSFNSVSSNKDLIAANFWYTRVKLK